jgi:HK97 gp10 family phage protein
VTLSIKVDASEVTEALDALDKKGSTKALKAAVKKSAMFLKPKVKAAAPKRTGNLRKRVGYRTKKGRNGDYYSVVRSFAPHHHLVVEGTEDRFTRSGAFRGQMPSNSFVTQVANANEDQALRIAEEELARQLDL